MTGDIDIAAAEIAAALAQTTPESPRRLSAGEHRAKIARLTAAWAHAAECLSWASQSGAPEDEIRSLSAQVELIAHRTVAARKAFVAAVNEARHAAQERRRGLGEVAEYIGLRDLRSAKRPENWVDLTD